MPEVFFLREVVLYEFIKNIEFLERDAVLHFAKLRKARSA
jgi:hypothetical protein